MKQTRILTLDVGNSQVFGGVFSHQGELQMQFRKSTKGATSSDELGVFFRSVLRENDISPEEIEKIAVCSVVPDLNHTIASSCVKYFGKNPFLLKAGVKTGLSIGYTNPLDVGADRIANAIAASKRHPGKNMIIVDFGTATTFCAVARGKDYLGGMIVPGMRLMMESLEANTSKLPKVSIMRSQQIISRSTIESIQGGIYQGTLATCRHVIEQVRKTTFKNQECMVIGTGGFARLFEEEGLFDEFVPELVLRGLFDALEMNT